MNNVVKKNLDNSGITNKIELIINSLFKNCINTSLIINRFVNKFPNLLKKSIIELNNKIFCFPPGRSEYINPKQIKIIQKDISSLVNMILNSNSFKLIDNDNIKNIFILEMTCLKALIMLNFK